MTPDTERKVSRAAVQADNARPPVTHELKTWASYFHALFDGQKNFEIRKDDRDFRIGDTLRLRETNYRDGSYTGRECERVITYILRREPEFGLADGYAILSLALLASQPEAEGMRSEGVCETTLTERFSNPKCVCGTYPENKGPCKVFVLGMNGMCAACDHSLICHYSLLQNATAPTVPAGDYVLVPRTPSDPMMDIFSGTKFSYLPQHKQIAELKAYDEMLAAAGREGEKS